MYILYNVHASGVSSQTMESQICIEKPSQVHLLNSEDHFEEEILVEHTTHELDGLQCVVALPLPSIY